MSGFGPAIGRLADALHGLTETIGAAAAQPEAEAHTAPSPVSRTHDYAALCRLWSENGPPYLARGRERPCPACSAADGVPLFVSQDGHPYVRCADCRTWYVRRPVPEEAWTEYQRRPEVAVIHDRQFAFACSDEYLASDKVRFERYFRAIRTVAPELPSPARYVDIGCFTGNSLRVARALGFQPFGIERSPRAVEYVRSRDIAETVCTTTSELQDVLEARPVEVVSLWESLEHDVDPAGTLREARRLLAPGGWLGVTVPNARSVLPLVLKEYCFYSVGGADAQGHINLFTPESLRRLVCATGFEPVLLETHYSTDWEQVAYYLSGSWERIFCVRNLASGSCFGYERPNWVRDLSRGLGPALSALETELDMGPMIFLLARAVGSAAAGTPPFAT